MNKGRNPFSAGRWVVGDSFFGRGELIQKVLDSNEACGWIIGQRRVGKTSILRQMEWLLNHQESERFGLFWDIQGSFNAEGLQESLMDAIDDSMDEFPDMWEGLDIDLSADRPCHMILKQLARSTSNKGRKLVILIDEAEEFMSIGQENPKILSKLRKIFQNSRLIHTVISSTPKLEQFHKTISMETSPLLHGFHARYLGHFSEQETMKLLKRGIPDDRVCHQIFEKTAGHPYETQLLAKHFFENPNFESICIELEANPSLVQVLEVNFELLNEAEQDILKDVFCGQTDKRFYDSSKKTAVISKLQQMGYLRSDALDILAIGSHFLSKWLGTKFDAEPTFHSQNDFDPVLSTEHSQVLCSQIVTVYKFFLETLQEGLIPSAIGPHLFRISNFDKNIYPNREQLNLVPSEISGDPWQVAIKTTATLLQNMLDPEDSWPLFRFCEMAESNLKSYSETDFLDLMLLISEEAALA